MMERSGKEILTPSLDRDFCLSGTIMGPTDHLQQHWWKSYLTLYSYKKAFAHGPPQHNHQIS